MCVYERVQEDGHKVVENPTILSNSMLIISIKTAKSFLVIMHYALKYSKPTGLNEGLHFISTILQLKGEC